MYEYFKLTDKDKAELLSITARLKRSSDRNLTAKPLPADVTEEDISFAEENALPHEFFEFFTIDRVEVKG